MLVNGDLEFKDSSVIHIENDGSSSHSNFVVTGEVTGTGSIFAISATEYKALEFDRFIVLEAHGGISTTSDNARDINAVLNAKNTYLRSLYTQLEESRSTTDNAALKAYNALFIKDEQILELSTNLIDKNIANSGLKNYVIFEMLNSPSHKAATASAVNNSAKSIANSNSAVSSQQQIINLANEAAINARMVYLKNPYKSDEENMGNMAYEEAGRTYATFINNTDKGS